MTERATETIVVAADPDTLFAVAVDLEDYPEWVADLKSVTVTDRDEKGRPTRRHLPSRRVRAVVHLHAALRLRQRSDGALLGDGRG